MRASRGSRAAFTLVELLVVIGIIALLISILLPTLGRARDAARNVKCMAQLHNLSEAVAIYVGQSKGKIPQHASGVTGGGACSWMWDIPKGTRDALVKQGGSRNTLYCPFFYEQNVDALWDGTFTGGNFDFSVIGYIWMGQRLEPDPANAAILRPSTRMPQLKTTTAARAYITTTRPPAPEVATTSPLYPYYPRVPAETELAIDAIISQQPWSGTAPTSWAAKGGWSDVHVSSHLVRGVPTGVNILYLDGHVGFRPYKAGGGLKTGTVYKRLSTGNPQIEFWF